MFLRKTSTKKLLLFVDVKDKTTELISSSVVTKVMSNMVMNNVSTTLDSAAIDASNEPTVGHVVNWDSLEILLVVEDQVSVDNPVVDEALMYEFLGLRDEDERAEKESLADEQQQQTEIGDMDFEVPELEIDDCIPGE